jgi:ATP phosphoribosyltransferase regulatory subunit
MRVEPTVPADVLARIRAPFEAAGGLRVDAPLLQPLNLLLDLAGEAMRTRLFVVQSEGASESCLRPDFTVAIARQHLDGGQPDGRYVYQGSAYRASAGSDRPEEFVQTGLEIMSAEPASATADAEIAGLAWAAAGAGQRADLSLWLGDVALFAAFLETLDLGPVQAGRLARLAGRPRLLAAELARVGGAGDPTGGRLAGLLSGLSETDAAALLEEVWALAGVEPVGGRGPAEIARRLIRKSEAAAAPSITEDQATAIRAFMAIDDTPTAAFERVRALAGPEPSGLTAALDAWDVRLAALWKVVPQSAMRFTPALGHAFDYYDGITFEVRSAALGPERPVAVGGRYDGLLLRLGGRADVSAVGCMVRPWRAWAGGEA